MSPLARAPAGEGAQSPAGEAVAAQSECMGVNMEIRGSLFPCFVGFVGHAELQGKSCPPQMLLLSSHGSIPEVINSSRWEMNAEKCSEIPSQKG